jgi:hypothetical protein
LTKQNRPFSKTKSKLKKNKRKMNQQKHISWIQAVRMEMLKDEEQEIQKKMKRTRNSTDLEGLQKELINKKTEREDYQRSVGIQVEDASNEDYNIKIIHKKVN